MAESYNICLDIGGTKVLGVVFNSKKEIVFRWDPPATEVL